MAILVSSFHQKDMSRFILFISRDGEAVTHQAHNLKNAGSIPAPVTMVLEVDAYASGTKLQGCWTRMSTYYYTLTSSYKVLFKFKN